MTKLTNWDRKSAQKLRAQLSDEASEIIDYLAENPDKKFTPDALVSALGLENAGSLRSYLGKTTIGAKQVGIPQDDPHSWFVQWDNTPEWRYWLDSERATWWLSGSGWSDEELRAAIKRYLEMLRAHRAGEPFSKKGYFELLAKKFGRTSKAFEYRAQNISYVFDLMGRDWLPGLKPARNVGAQVAERIELLIAEIEGSGYSGMARFEIEVITKRRKKTPLKPVGQMVPQASTSKSTNYKRDANVVDWILREAGDRCESCGSEAPFITGDGRPFLEVHHVRRLADGGSDTVENAVAVCPNCHRALHHAANRQDRAQNLYQIISRLVKN